MKRTDIENATNFLDSWLEYHRVNSEVPGIIAAVGVDGDIAYHRAFGVANIESQEPMTTGHLIRVASHSKMFTATALLQLMEQGKLDIYQPIPKVLPWLAEHNDNRWRDVTVSQLMSHSAGIIRDGRADYWSLEFPYPDESELKADILAADLVFDPNTIMKYSNYGYSVLGQAIEVVSGQAYGDYVTENIITPLGLSNTGPEYDRAKTLQYATGYTKPLQNHKLLPIDHCDTRAMAAATGLYSTTEDITTFLRAQRIGSGLLLKDSTKREMQRLHWKGTHGGDRIGYGLGLDHKIIEGKLLLGHGGGFPGFSTDSYFDPETGLSIVVMTNRISGGAKHFLSGIFHTVNHFASRGDGGTSPEMLRYEGRYLDLYDTEQFVACGNELYSIDPHLTHPFVDNQPLEKAGEHTFRYQDSGSWSVLGETITFALGPDGKATHITAGGYTRHRELGYYMNLESRQKISLRKEKRD